MSLHKYNTNQPDMQYRCLTFPMLCPVHSRITLASVTPLSRQALRHSGVSDAGVMRTKAGESRALPLHARVRMSFSFFPLKPLTVCLPRCCPRKSRTGKGKTTGGEAVAIPMGIGKRVFKTVRGDAAQWMAEREWRRTGHKTAGPVICRKGFVFQGRRGSRRRSGAAFRSGSAC